MQIKLHITFASVCEMCLKSIVTEGEFTKKKMKNELN